MVTGGAAETQQLLTNKFDYIFFTGSTTIGRLVREASNKYLTPVTLELGGKRYKRLLLLLTNEFYHKIVDFDFGLDF